eukprot:1615321-Pleurochrysis_carterae.AAC.1
MLRHERAARKAARSGTPGSHVEAFGVHTEPCTEGADLLKVTATTERVGHWVGCAKDVARTWSCALDERNAGMACKYSSARWAASSFLRRPRGGRSRRKSLIPERHVGRGERMRGRWRNGGNQQRHELERGNAVGVTRVWREGKEK